jgi:hypothetical protein
VAFDVSLTVHVPVATALVVVAAGLAVDVGDDAVATTVGAVVAVAGAAPPHEANSTLAVASGTAMRDRYREIIGSSAVWSSDLTRRRAASR